MTHLNRRNFLKMTTAAALMPAAGGCGGPDIMPADGVPRGPFDDESTAEAVTEGLDLSGKVAVVTGCTSGIGFETMRVLAMRGAHVIGTGRTEESAQEACLKVNGLTSGVGLELADFDSVVHCADIIRRFNTPVDILVCNAGMRGGDRETAYGLEKHFVVNHLGHFILVNQLMDRLYFSDQGRVVIVASRAAYRSAPAEGIEFSNLRGARNYDTRRAYAHSKLANVLFSLELARLLRGSRITSNALHPGVIDTNIVRHESAVTRGAFGLWTKMTGKTVEQGAATSCYVATSPLLGAVSGEYFEDCNAVHVVGDNHMRNQEMATRLWQASETLAADYLIDHSRRDWTRFEDGRKKRPGA